MNNIEHGNNALRQEGIPSPGDIENALKAQQEELDNIAEKAEKALSAAGGSYPDAIETAVAAGDTLLAEKLTVMENLNATEA